MVRQTHHKMVRPFNLLRAGGLTHKMGVERAKPKALARQGHRVPADLRKALISSPVVQSAWGDITPLARNEWICWIISAKKAETRSHRIERARSELRDGKRRPCCWAGCIHR